VGAEPFGLKWIEEALSPDDYWGYADLPRAIPKGMPVATGEHAATGWGFCLLLDMGPTSFNPMSGGAEG
jgi:L-rhamnonate dehydratase